MENELYHMNFEPVLKDTKPDTNLLEHKKMLH